MEDNLTALSLLSISDQSTHAVVSPATADEVALVANVTENHNYNNYTHNYDNSNNSNSNYNCDDSNRIRFPVRLEADDCAFYMKTGFCKFGITCKFNHPPFPQGAKVNGTEEYFDTASENVNGLDDYVEKQTRVYCKYFDRPGGCKYGSACKYTHSKRTSPASEFNFMGLPIRQGEIECPYYMRNGSCKFGASCRFNHPDPTSVGGLDSSPSHNNKGSISSPTSPYNLNSQSSPAVSTENPSYMPLMLQPSQGVLPHREWTAHQALAYQPRAMHMAPKYTMNRLPPEQHVYPHQPEQILDDEFPERPGEPECTYFVKTGNCKYKSACKFHHPKNASEKASAYSLSELGLPLRPGKSMCSYYSRYGICKYGPVCKYDHPVNYAHAAEGMTSGIANSIVNHAMAAGS